VRFGYEPVLADSGETALAAFDRPGADAICAMVLDLMMPGLDGLGVLGRLGERAIKVPVIVQTAQGGIETVVSAMRAGAVDFVVKPVSPDRLRSVLANALKVGALEDST